MEETTDVYLCLNCGLPIIKDKRSKKIRSTRFHNGCRDEYMKRCKTITCGCGCGELVTPFDVNGLPRRFRPGHWAKTEENRAEKTPNFNGYRYQANDGYCYLYRPEHQSSDKRGYVLEHRFVWEENNKALLLCWGVVHHKNHIRYDNQIQNLTGMMKHQHDYLESLRRQRNNKGQFV